MRFSFITFGLLFLPGVVTVLGACSPETDNTQIRQEIVHEQDTADFPVTIELRVLEEREKTSEIGIVINNPQSIPIQSVRAWLVFDPDALEVLALHQGDGRFPLTAPGEWDIDGKQGWLKLGTAASDAVTDTTILYATLEIRGSGELSFYDWRPSGDGHTAVLSIEDSTLRNVASLPSAISL